MDRIGRRGRWEPFSRLAGSWVGLAAVCCVGLVGVAAAATVFDARLHNRARAEVHAQATLIAGLVTHGELRGDELAAGVPAAAQQRMRARVQSLQRRGDILGLQLWTAAGQPLFAEPAAGQAPTEVTLQAGRTVVSGDGRRRSPEPEEVTVRLDPDGDRDGAVVAVVRLPPNRLDEIRATARARLGWVGGVLGLLLAGALALARRRQLHRDHAARHDHLTGLGNRTMLAEEARRRGSGAYALLLLDLDGFKDVNDTLGHAAGDELLVQVAAALRRGVGRGDLVIRLGGDEFAVLLEAITDPQDALRVARGLLDTLAGAGFSVRGIDLEVQASVGVAVNGAAGVGASALLRQADAAMYRAKEHGAAVVAYSADVDRHDTDRLAMLGELRRAIAADELVLHYQPIVPVPAGRGTVMAGAAGAAVTAVEALVRWQHPDRGLLPPESFLPVAEHTGVIHDLTAWVLDRAVAQAASWRRSGLDLAVSVNLSPRAITGSLVSLVLSTLGRHDLPAAGLTLEITEAAVAGDAAATIATLRELRTAGVRISLDDFGADTSLAHLTALPLAELKIDRGFVESVAGHDDTRAVVAAVIQLGHRLGLSVVAEGVETRATSHELAALGCDAVQGVVCSPPLRPAQIEGWVTARNDHRHAHDPA